MEIELWMPTADVALTGEVVPLKTWGEVRERVERIKASLASIREDMYAFAYGREWEVLGYDSFKDSLMVEFGMSESRAYQLIDAYKIDAILAGPSTDADSTIVESISVPIPEGHARALAPLKDDPEAVREVYTEVVTEAKREGRKPRAKDVKEKVRRRRAPRPGLNPAVHVPGQVVKPPRPPRDEPALTDRLYKTVLSFPDKAVSTALAEEIQAENLDLPKDVARKLSDHLTEAETGRRTLKRVLESIATRRNGTT